MLHSISRNRRVLLPALAACLLGAQSPPAPAPIENAASLPRLTYRLQAPPSRTIHDLSRMRMLAADVERNSRRMLEEYRISDSSTRRDLLIARSNAALVRGDPQAALAFDRAATGTGRPSLATDLLVAALSVQRARGGSGDAALRRAVRARLDLSDAEARDTVISFRRELALASNAVRFGELASFADPEWQRNPVVGQEFAAGMLRFWIEINLRNPLVGPLEAELARWLGRHPAASPEIWAARDIAAADGPAGAVTIGIWDGVDPALVSGRSAGGPVAPPIGRGDAGEGGLEGAVGLAFDEHFNATTGSLLPVPERFARRFADYERYMRGIGELAAGLDGPEVAFARAWRRRLAPADVEAFDTGYRFYTNFIHGTHVAGIAIRGLPRARLVPVRITFSSVPPPLLLDEAAANRFAAMVATATRYFRMRGVRVCNISWGYTPQDIEDGLAQNGVEPDPEARARRASRIFEIMYAGMAQAISSAPDTLFVVAAGNAGQDIDFVRDLPGSINLPNVLTVGAADAQGRLAGFASRGASVDLYALGTNVESLVPGGGRLRWSGASLAAPQVVNAAAKLLTIEPALRPAELARLLIRTAAPAPGSDLPLLNAAAARRALLASRTRPPPTR